MLYSTHDEQFQYYYSSSYNHRDQGLDPMGKGLDRFLFSIYS